MERLAGLEFGQFLDTGFQLFDLLTQLLGFCTLRGCELIFQALKPAFLSLFVDLRLANVLALFERVC